MIREVKIDGQLVDVNDENAEGYIFNSPIFRDLNDILSNRTSTYKIPITDYNRKVFGLSDNPEVISDFPYQEHNIEEWRNGILFFRGVCALLATNDNNFELSVTWGNTINLLKLRDLNLRDLSSDDSLRWNSNTPFMDYNSTDNFGFPLLDFGKGINDMQYIHPSVNLQYIIDLITSNTSVEFQYPSRFNQIFPKTWIPLTDKNANRLTWNDYRAQFNVDNIFTYPAPISENHSYLKLNVFGGGSNIIDAGNNYSYIKGKSGATVEIYLSAIFNVGNISSNPGQYKLMIYAYGGGQTFDKKFFDIVKNEDGNWTSTVSMNMTFDLSQDIDIALRCSYTTDENPYLNLASSTVSNIFASTAYVKYDEVRLGDVYPIVPNLPDLTCVEFLKSLMWMYGLFTYYNRNDSKVYFISIDDIYRKKPDAYDWTHKLIDTTAGRFRLVYGYGSYKQNNIVLYAEDDTVKTNANGVIKLNNLALGTKPKDLFTLPYAPSDNITIGEANNTYARIPLYQDENGNVETNNVTYRVLSEGRYKQSDTILYKSLFFDESQKFSGDRGLLNEHYKAYQHILQHPIVATCYIYLEDMELCLFDESRPVFIDGVYYAPVQVTVQPNGLATCNLIKMPYLDIEEEGN